MKRVYKYISGIIFEINNIFMYNFRTLVPFHCLVDGSLIYLSTMYKIKRTFNTCFLWITGAITVFFRKINK